MLLLVLLLPFVALENCGSLFFSFFFFVFKPASSQLPYQTL